MNFNELDDAGKIDLFRKIIEESNSDRELCEVFFATMPSRIIEEIDLDGRLFDTDDIGRVLEILGEDNVVEFLGNNPVVVEFPFGSLQNKIATEAFQAAIPGEAGFGSNGKSLFVDGDGFQCVINGIA